MSSNHNAVTSPFLLLNIGHALNHYLLLVFPTVALFLMQPWQMSYAELIKLGSVGALAYGAGALPAGWLADRYGRHTMMTVFLLSIGLASILTGMAQHPWQLMLAVSLVGLFAAIYHPVGIAMVYEISDKPGRALAINGVAGNLGLAVAAICTTGLAQYLGWCWAFILPGVLALLCGYVYAKSTNNFILQTEHQLKSTNLDKTKTNMVYIFIAILVIAACGGLVFNSLTTALPKIIAETYQAKEFSITKVGGIATAMLIFSSMAQLIIAVLLEKYSPEKLLICLTSMQVIALFIASESESPMGPLLVAIFLTFAQIPVNDMLIGKNSSNAWRSRFYAMKYTIGLSIASIAYWLIALSHESSLGFNMMLTTLALVMCAAVGAAVTLVYFKKAPSECGES